MPYRFILTLMTCLWHWVSVCCQVDGMTENEYTYGELHQAIKRVASGLKKLGLKQRQILTIISPNSPEYFIIFYATLACGAAVSTINPVYTACEYFKNLCNYQHPGVHSIKSYHTTPTPRMAFWNSWWLSELN